MTESEKNAEIVRLRERCALLESLLGEGIRHHYFNEAVCFSIMAFGSEPRGHALSRIVPSLLSGTGTGDPAKFSGRSAQRSIQQIRRADSASGLRAFAADEDG